MAGQILIVDDDETIRSSLRLILEDEGYTVATAGDGLEALNYLRGAAMLPSLILLDLMMPRMNGWEFNEERDLDARLASIPVAVITAAGHAEEAARPIHPVKVIRKPVNLEKLLEFIRSLVR